MLLAAQILDLCGACWRVEKSAYAASPHPPFFVFAARQLIESVNWA
jgi:hypothetical protein